MHTLIHTFLFSPPHHISFSSPYSSSPRSLFHSFLFSYPITTSSPLLILGKAEVSRMSHWPCPKVMDHFPPQAQGPRWQRRALRPHANLVYAPSPSFTFTFDVMVQRGSPSNSLYAFALDTAIQLYRLPRTFTWMLEKQVNKHSTNYSFIVNGAPCQWPWLHRELDSGVNGWLQFTDMQ